VIIGQEPVLYL